MFCVEWLVSLCFIVNFRPTYKHSGRATLPVMIVASLTSSSISARGLCSKAKAYFAVPIVAHRAGTCFLSDLVMSLLKRQSRS